MNAPFHTHERFIGRQIGKAKGHDWEHNWPVIDPTDGTIVNVLPADSDETDQYILVDLDEHGLPYLAGSRCSDAVVPVKDLPQKMLRALAALAEDVAWVA